MVIEMKNKTGQRMNDGPDNGREPFKWAIVYERVSLLTRRTCDIQFFFSFKVSDYRLCCHERNEHLLFCCFFFLIYIMRMVHHHHWNCCCYRRRRWYGCVIIIIHNSAVVTRMTTTTYLSHKRMASNKIVIFRFWPLSVVSRIHTHPHTC